MNANINSESGLPVPGCQCGLCLPSLSPPEQDILDDEPLALVGAGQWNLQESVQKMQRLLAQGLPLSELQAA